MKSKIILAAALIVATNSLWANGGGKSVDSAGHHVDFLDIAHGGGKSINNA